MSTGETTVIITTHYTDEARCSDFVGFMRGGRLITEKAPSLLLEDHNTASLSQVVLELCKGTPPTREDGIGKQRVKPAKINSQFEDTSFKSSLKRIRAIGMKNLVTMTRNPVYISLL